MFVVHEHKKKKFPSELCAASVVVDKHSDAFTDEQPSSPKAKSKILLQYDRYCYFWRDYYFYTEVNCNLGAWHVCTLLFAALHFQHWNVNGRKYHEFSSETRRNRNGLRVKVITENAERPLVQFRDAAAKKNRRTEAVAVSVRSFVKSTTRERLCPNRRRMEQIHTTMDLDSVPRVRHCCRETGKKRPASKEISSQADDRGGSTQRSMSR